MECSLHTSLNREEIVLIGCKNVSGSNCICIINYSLLIYLIKTLVCECAIINFKLSCQSKKSYKL